MPKTDFSSATWRKSSHSTSQTDQRVEVAAIKDHIGIRDSKNPAGPVPAVSRESWHHLARLLKNS